MGEGCGVANRSVCQCRWTRPALTDLGDEGGLPGVDVQRGDAEKEEQVRIHEAEVQSTEHIVREIERS